MVLNIDLKTYTACCAALRCEIKRIERVRCFPRSRMSMLLNHYRDALDTMQRAMHGDFFDLPDLDPQRKLDLHATQS